MRARPRRWVIVLSASMAVLLALALAGCGNGDSGTVAVNPHQAVPPAVSPDYDEPLPADGEVTQPELPEEVPLGLAEARVGLPAFPGSDGDGPFSDYRTASEEGQRVVDGDQRVAEAGSGNYPAEESDGYVIVPGGDDELCAWVQFSLPEFDAVRPVIIYFEVDAAPLVPGGDDELPLAYWVAVANFTTYRWQWYGPFDEADGFKLNSPMVKDRYVGEDGVQHFVVLTMAGQQYAGEGNPQGLTAARVETTRISTLTVDDPGYFHTNPHYVGIDSIQLGTGGKQAALDSDRQFVTLTWTHHRDYEDPNGEAFMYQVERRDAVTGERVLLGSKTAPGYDYVDPSDNDSALDEAVPGRTYKYYVRAANPLNGFTPWSLARQVTIPSVLPVADLQADPLHGPPPLLVSFDASGSHDEDGEITRYEFDFGEGGGWEDYGSSDAANHEYADSGDYLARLRVTDDMTDSNLATLEIVVNSPPTAALTADPVEGAQPLTVDFDASASTDEDGTIENYAWDFNGDGIFSGEQGALWEEDMYAGFIEAQCTYLDGGDYTASVRAWDDDNDSDTAEASVAVYPTWTHTWGCSAADEATDGIIVPDSGPGSGPGIYLTGVTMNGSESDVLLLKYNSAGVRQWVRAWGAEADSDSGNGIAHDDDGHLYVCGLTDSSQGAGGQDALLLRYDSDGDVSWQKTWGGTGSDVAYDVAVDPDDGSVYVVGHTNSFGEGGSDVFLLRYSSSGTLEAQRVWGGIYDDRGYGLCVDGLDNLWIAGQSIRNAADDEALLLLRFSRSTGALLWQKTWGSTADGHETGWAVVSDSSAYAYVCGTSELTGAGYRDCVALKYDMATGALLWAKTWGGPLNENGHDVCLYEGGSLLLTGNTNGFTPGENGLMHLSLSTATGLGLGSWIWQCQSGPSASGASVVPDPQTGLLCLTGSAGRRGGSWHSLNEDSADASGSPLDITETLQDALGTAKDISGTSGTPAGSDDDDGGDDADALVMMVDPASL